MTEKTNALDVQIAGSHYKGMAIQPMEFSMANNWDACAHTILKYLSRHKQKSGLEDLRKARHCVDLRLQLHVTNPGLKESVGMDAFCRANGLPAAEERVLLKLETWVSTDSAADGHRLAICLDDLIAQYEDARMDNIIRNGNDGLPYQQT